MHETAGLADALFAGDPELKKPENQALRKYIATSQAKLNASAGVKKAS